jgi:hypothetical protein
MHGKEWGGRGRRLRALLVAATLAGLTTLMAAGAASADWWPSGQSTAPVVVQS